MKSILLEIGFPLLKAYTLTYITFPFLFLLLPFRSISLFSRTFFLESIGSPCLKRKIGFQTPHHKFVFVLHNKAQLTIPIPSGKICLCITKEDTTNNSNSNWTKFVLVLHKKTTNNSNWINLSWYYTTNNSNWTSFSSNSKKTQEDKNNNSNWTNLSSNSKKTQEDKNNNSNWTNFSSNSKKTQTTIFQFHLDKFVFQFFPQWSCNSTKLSMNQTTRLK
jgi:hypothetical protein